jgi:hypothetical protein
VAIRGRRCSTAEYVGEPIPVWSAIIFTDVICEELVEIAISSHTNALHQRVLPCRAYSGSVAVEVEVRYRRAVLGGATKPRRRRFA